MELQELVGKAASDPEFARALSENPEQTLMSVGVPPTPEMIEALKGVDAASVQRMAAAFGDDKTASF